MEVHLFDKFAKFYLESKSGRPTESDFLASSENLGHEVGKSDDNTQPSIEHFFGDEPSGRFTSPGCKDILNTLNCIRGREAIWSPILQYA